MIFWFIYALRYLNTFPLYETRVRKRDSVFICAGLNYATKKKYLDIKLLKNIRNKQEHVLFVSKLLCFL